MALKQGEQFKSLAGRSQFPVFPDNIFFIDQFFNDGGPGGRGAKPAFLHRFGQLFVVDQLAGMFHGCEQGRLG